MPKKKGKKREQAPEEPMTAREMETLRNRRHTHVCELYGPEQVAHLRRPYRESLGYA